MTFLPTDCAEAGVDFSFCTAFRKSWGLVNLLQIAGGLRIGDRRSQISDCCAASAGLLIEDFRSQMDNKREQISDAES